MFLSFHGNFLVKERLHGVSAEMPSAAHCFAFTCLPLRSFIMRLCWSLNVNPLNHTTHTCNSFVRRFPFTQFSLTTLALPLPAPTDSFRHIQTIPYIINHHLPPCNNFITLFHSATRRSSRNEWFSRRQTMRPVKNQVRLYFEEMLLPLQCLKHDMMTNSSYKSVLQNKLWPHLYIHASTPNVSEFLSFVFMQSCCNCHRIRSSCQSVCMVFSTHRTDFREISCWEFILQSISQLEVWLQSHSLYLK